MLAFVTSLPHPANCGSYERVAQLLRASLESMCAQRGGDFRVYVVGNGDPPIELPDQVRWVSVAFPPAHKEGATWHRRENHDRGVRDKGLKLVIAILAARAEDADFIMFADADDLVSNRLAGHCAAHPGSPGWYVDRGYVYWQGSGRIVETGEFYRHCGTSFVLAAKLLPMPESLSARSSPDELLATLAPRFFDKLITRHPTKLEYLAERGVELAPLPFAGAVWMRGTQENLSNYAGFPSLLGAEVSDELRAEFALRAPPADLAHDLMRFFPQALGAYPPMLRKHGLRRTIALAAGDIPQRMRGFFGRKA